jgi:hypothetical protein
MADVYFDQTHDQEQIVDLTLTIGAFRLDKFYASGTAFVVKPRIAITAKHVIDDFYKKFDGINFTKELNEGKLGTRKAGFNLSAVQHNKHAKNSSTYIWDIQHIYVCLLTDIVFLYLLPKNEETWGFCWKVSMIDFNPPKVGENIFGFGFHSSKSEFTYSDNTLTLQWSSIAATSKGQVVEVYNEKRDSVNLPFPCFQTNARFDGGMSGGPVINERGYLCGVICSGIDTKDENCDAVSYVALLWPAMITHLSTPHPICQSKRSYPALSLFNNNDISIGWEK